VKERGIKAKKETASAWQNNNANAFCHALINHNLWPQHWKPQSQNETTEVTIVGV